MSDVRVLGKSYVVPAADLLKALGLPDTDRIVEVKRTSDGIIIDVTCLDTMPSHILERWKGK